MKTDLVKKYCLCCIALLLVVMLVALLIMMIFTKDNSQEVVVRSVIYNYQDISDDSAYKEFDEHEFAQTDEGFKLSAQKSFDSSIFENLDLVNIENANEKIAVNYEIEFIESENTFLLSVTLEKNNGLPIIEVLPGLLTYNSAGELDIMFVSEEETFWLSDLEESNIVSEEGWFTSLLSKVASKIGEIFVRAVAYSVRQFCRVAVMIGGESARDLGAKALDMYKENGIYHANFDCWQEAFGYNDFYNKIFDLSTSMNDAQFEFDVNSDGISDYMMWAWKGDYWELGAGAELGLYKRWTYSSSHWIVDKSMAMEMSLVVKRNNITIINWSDKTWWITAFNPKHLDVNEKELSVTYKVKFNNTTLLNGFKSDRFVKQYWSFNGNYATFNFNEGDKK